eukprot:1041440-Rhodomonas_salina.1
MVVLLLGVPFVVLLLAVLQGTHLLALRLRLGGCHYSEYYWQYCRGNWFWRPARVARANAQRFLVSVGICTVLPCRSKFEATARNPRLGIPPSCSTTYPGPSSSPQLEPHWHPPASDRITQPHPPHIPLHPQRAARKSSSLGFAIQ